MSILFTMRMIFFVIMRMMSIYVIYTSFQLQASYYSIYVIYTLFMIICVWRMALLIICVVLLHLV
jgi:hypothetical protein